MLEVTSYKVPFLGFRILKAKPEHSLLLRISIALTILISIFALLREESWPGFGIWIVLLTIFGFWTSWIRREKENWWLRFILAFSMIFVGVQGIAEIVSTPYDPRVPLANLLLKLQVIHNFDMPSRKDLNYSLLVSLIFMSLASVFSNDLIWGLFFLFYLVSAMVSVLIISYRDAEDSAKKSIKFSPDILKSFSKLFFFILIATLILAFSFFIFIPRFRGFGFMKITPIAFHFPKIRLFNGNIANPGYLVSPGDVTSPHFRSPYHMFNPNSYFGFNPYLDLSDRGKLSNKVVMKVKSQRGGYWRGLVFDDYSGDGWTISPQKPEPITVDNSFVSLSPVQSRGIDYAQVVQSYFIETQLPNLVFFMYQPNIVYFPSPLLYRDLDESLRIPFYLEPGTAYTVISQVPKNIISNLRISSEKYPRILQEQYTKVPDRLPYRVKKLAFLITAHQHTPYGKIIAIISWLRQFSYSLDIPPPPPGRDAVDHFLLDLKKGYCEQFASSLAILGRSVGIPTRLVTGYSTGTYNPFTMNFEVRENDAHAWVEVYFSNIGWVAFDPSPSFAEVPMAKEENVFAGASEVISYINKLLEPFFLELEKNQWFWSLRNLKFRTIVFCFAIFLFVFQLFIIFRKYFVLKRAEKTYPFSSMHRKAITVAYLHFEKELSSKGYQRASCETPLELLLKLPQGQIRQKSFEFIQEYHKGRYSLDPLESEIKNAKAILEEIETII